MPEGIYLDWAATAAVRPPEVGEAVSTYLRECGGIAGVGGHRIAAAAAETGIRCREAVGRVLGVGGGPERIALLPNATTALNVALSGVVRAGDVVVATAYDHNATRRPLAHLQRERGVEVRLIGGDPDGTIDLDEAARLLEGARLLVVNAASNVMGNRLPVRELAARAHAAGALVVVDAAQAAGRYPLRLEADGADLVGFTGHKGLLGPPGTGGLWVREGVEVEPLLYGGGAGGSERVEMPEAMPGRLEAGTGNAPGWAGLLAGIAFLEARGIEALAAHEARLKDRLWNGLQPIGGVRVRTPRLAEGIGVVTIDTAPVDPALFAERLDREWGIMTRPGLHAAPDAHRILGTLERGAVRLSLGWATTEQEIDVACEAVEAVARSAP